MEEYNLLSNKELIEKYNEFTEKFTNAQDELKKNYTNMVHYSNEAIKIKDILTKRGTKI